MLPSTEKMLPPSPYRVAVGLLLRFYVSGRPLETEEETSPFLESVVTALERLALADGDRDPTTEAVFILEEIENMSQVRDKPFATLLESLDSACGGPWASCLQECLRAVRSPDDLVTIISLLKELKAPPQLLQADGTTVRPTHCEPDSFFGMYIRQLVLEFHRVVFEGLSNLVDDLQVWLSGGEEEDDDEEVSEGGEKEEGWTRGRAVAGGEGRDRASVWGASARMAQEYLQQRVLDLEYDLGRRSYQETESEIAGLLRIHPELPRGQFLRYLNSMHHKEFTGALDAVHRYFDYAVQRGGPNALGKSSTRHIVQYAVLNLAALHFRFGHTELALTAIKETIRIAQQNGDHTCVAFALAWMQQLLAKSGDFQAEEVLLRCIARAGEQKLRHLRSVAALSLASFEAVGGVRFHQQAMISMARNATSISHMPEVGSLISSRPRRVWESLRLSVPIEPQAPLPQPSGGFAPHQASNVAGSLTAALQSRDSFPLTLEEAFKLSARRCLVTAGAWEMLGHRELVLGQSNKLLYCYGREATSVDTSLAVIKTAMARLRGPPPASYVARVKEEPQDDNHDDDDDGEECVYSQALKDLCGLKERFPVSIANVWSHCTTMVLHEWALNRGEVQRAHDLGLLLFGLSPEDSVYGVEAYVEAMLQWTLGLLVSGRISECVRATNKLAAFCERRGLPWHYARCLLQLASAHLKACPFDPTSALPPLLRCISFCETFDIDVLHAVSFLLLAQVHLRLNSASKARAMVKAALPVILEHAPVRTQGEAWVTLAKCHMQEASASGGPSAEAAEEALLHICTLLSRAQAAFTRSHDVTSLREVYYLQSRLHHRLSTLPPRHLTPLSTSPAEHVAKRDKAAVAFHRCSSFLLEASLRQQHQHQEGGASSPSSVPIGEHDSQGGVLLLLHDMQALRALTSDHLNKSKLAFESQ